MEVDLESDAARARARERRSRLARKLGFDDYCELVRFSAEEPERFWPAAIEDMGLEFSQPWDAVVDASRGPEWATWFVGGQAQHRLELRPPLGARRRGRRAGRGLRRARTGSGAR